jgi:CBS domain-containing protein
MGVIRKQNALSNLPVREAMRRQVITTPAAADLDRAIGRFIKYKVNALLVTDEADQPAGVLSKTDIMGAYYAGLPIETRVEDIMISPPLFCRADDPLEAALEQMRENGVYRLYVMEEDRLAGALAYPDIVGLLYRFCRECRYSRGRKKRGDREPLRFTVREVMTPSVSGYPREAPLVEIMEGLSAYRFGAVLIRDDAGRPAGVVSKTDLALAYKHGVDAGEPAKTVMSGPVLSCDADDFLEEAIRILIFSQVQRIFVHETDPQQIAGVLSLTDAARIRSGSCHACVSSRIKVEDGAHNSQ